MLLLLPAIAAPLAAAGRSGEQVNVYSHRHYAADRELFRRFTAETGIKVNVLEAGADELIERLRSEQGAKNSADLLVTADASRLHRAKTLGLLQPVSSPLLEGLVPPHLRDREGYWYGLTKRARVIVFDKSRAPSVRSRAMDYADLADPALGKSLLVRSSGNIYNVSLLSAIVAHDGEEAALSWARGVVENMARAPQGNDRDQMKALVAGVGDYALVNSYYVGLLLNSDDPAEQEVGEKIGVIFPDQDGRGSHINISGAGVSNYAPNQENALRLLEFLLGGQAQKIYAEQNHEYPVNPAVPWGQTVSGWGSFIEDSLDLEEIGRANDQALRIFDTAGWK